MPDWLEVDPGFEPDSLIRSDMDRIRRDVGWPADELSMTQLEDLRAAARLSRDVDLLTRKALSEYGHLSGDEWYRLRREINDKERVLRRFVKLL